MSVGGILKITMQDKITTIFSMKIYTTILQEDPSLENKLI